MSIGARVSATGDYFKGGVQEREPADAPVLLQHRISRRLIPDHYGHELPNLAAAQSKAHTLAQQMLAPAEHWRKAEFSIMSNGHEVARVPFARLEALPLNGPAAIMSGFKSAKRAACSQDRPWAQSELNAAVKGVSFGLTVVMARDHHPFGGAMRMAAMDHFDHILHWKLKQGSHAFPGKDGGTCINEAAIVAAGFPYQPVRSVEDMPACFSRPICALAMQLNDGVFDEERQQLLPFVTRLACADTPMVEREREAYIAGTRAGGYHSKRASQFLRGRWLLGDRRACPHRTR